MTHTTGIKAIETVYNGYRFRSRLEARWAVFFDTLGIRYEYEKEGFDFGEDGRYLPDFWLPELGIWAEVKGQTPTMEELDKARCLIATTGYPVLFLEQIVSTSNVKRTDIHLVGVDYSLVRARLHAQAFTLLNQPQIRLADGRWIHSDDNLVTWRHCPICANLTLMGAQESNWTQTLCGCVRRLFDDLYNFSTDLETPKKVTGLQHFIIAWAMDPIGMHPAIADAYDAARQARFEHGETPTVNKL